MVTTALFAALIAVLSAMVVLLLLSNSTLYLRLRSLAASRQPSLTSDTSPAGSTRPPNHHLATSDACSSLSHLPLPLARPPTFLQHDPALSRNVLADRERRPSFTKRISIATTVSRNGSRVLTRNPSTQDSHDTKIGSVRKRTKDDLIGERIVILERTKKNRKSFGVGNDGLSSFYHNNSGRPGVRQRSSTWTTEDLDKMNDPFSRAGGVGSKRFSLPVRRLSLGLRQEPFLDAATVPSLFYCEEPALSPSSAGAMSSDTRARPIAPPLPRSGASPVARLDPPGAFLAHMAIDMPLSGPVPNAMTTPPAVTLLFPSTPSESVASLVNITHTGHLTKLPA